MLAGSTPVLVHNEYCGPELSIDNKQFGKKWGEHARHFGLDPSDGDARVAFRAQIESAYDNPDEVRIGPWNPESGGANDYRFHRTGNLVVLTKADGTFVTTLNSDLGNGWWDGATVVRGP